MRLAPFRLCTCISSAGRVRTPQKAVPGSADRKSRTLGMQALAETNAQSMPLPNPPTRLLRTNSLAGLYDRFLTCT